MFAAERSPLGSFQDLQYRLGLFARS